MIELKNISKHFYFHKEKHDVLKDINFTITEQDYLTIIGKSGSGKSTLLNIISGLIPPTNGEILLYGKKLKSRLPFVSNDDFRSHHMGFVFQHFNLIPYHSILENVMIPLKFSSLPPKIHRGRALEMLRQMGIEDKKDYYPHMLSGGQMQRTAIARALIKNPKLIIADEPTGNLDNETAKEILDIFTQLNEEKKVAFLIVTHDSKVIERSKSVYRLENSQLEGLHS